MRCINICQDKTNKVLQYRTKIGNSLGSWQTCWTAEGKTNQIKTRDSFSPFNWNFALIWESGQKQTRCFEVGLRCQPWSMHYLHTQKYSIPPATPPIWYNGPMLYHFNIAAENGPRAQCFFGIPLLSWNNEKFLNANQQILLTTKLG